MRRKIHCLKTLYRFRLCLMHLDYFFSMKLASNHPNQFRHLMKIKCCFKASLITEIHQSIHIPYLYIVT